MTVITNEAHTSRCTGELKGDVVSVWLFIDDADVENACMHVIPGRPDVPSYDSLVHGSGTNLADLTRDRVVMSLLQYVSATATPITDSDRPDLSNHGASQWCQRALQIFGPFSRVVHMEESILDWKMLVNGML
ncbi:hypothetical protein Btru_067738 [Bulinus truncatus]|nr:hypothetical protein Btru_067738 [Bulinus truncatus]